MYHCSHHLHCICCKKCLLLGANLQSLQHLFCVVPQPIEIITFEGSWGVSLVHWNVVLVELRWKMLAEWWDSFQAALHACEGHREMMAHVLWIAEGGTFGVLQNNVRGKHFLATMAHNSGILWLHRSLAVCLVSCLIGQSGRTEECLDMVAAKAGNNTSVVDQIDLWAVWVECLCSMYSQHCYLMLPNCHLGIGKSQTAHLLNPYWLSSAEVCSSTSSVQNMVVINYQFSWGFPSMWSTVEITECSSDLRRNDGLLYPSIC